MDGGVHTSEARAWGYTLPCAADGGQDTTAVFGEGRLPVTEGIYIRLAHQLLGKPLEKHAPHHPFDKNSQ